MTNKLPEPYRPDPEKDYHYYADRVNLCWSRAIGGIVMMGYLLAEARMNLEPCEWRRLIVEECPFDLTVACKLMRIAQDQRVTVPDIAAKLPASWQKLYDLIQLPEPVFREGIEAGEISPAITKQQVSALRAKAKAQEQSNHEVVVIRDGPTSEDLAALRSRLLEVFAEFPFVVSLAAEIAHAQSVRVKRSQALAPAA